MKKELSSKRETNNILARSLPLRFGEKHKLGGFGSLTRGAVRDTNGWLCLRATKRCTADHSEPFRGSRVGQICQDQEIISTCAKSLVLAKLRPTKIADLPQSRAIHLLAWCLLITVVQEDPSCEFDMKRIGSSLTRCWTAYFLTVQTSLGGCASYEGKPGLSLSPMPYPYRTNHVEIYADPNLHVDRQRESFDTDRAKLGIIPVQVLIRNKGVRLTFEVPYSIFA